MKVKSVKPEVQEAYENWDHLVFEKIEKFEYFLQSVKSDLVKEGISMKAADTFLRQRIEEIRAEILARPLKKRFANISKRGV